MEPPPLAARRPRVPGHDRDASQSRRHAANACVSGTISIIVLFNTIDMLLITVSNQICATTNRIIRFETSRIGGTNVSSCKFVVSCGDNTDRDAVAGCNEGTGCANGIDCSET